MTLPRVLLAPAGYGKTAYALARIRAVRQTELLSPIWVVLPNQPQVSAFRRRLAAAGGAMGIRLGSFYTVYADLLARAGRPAPRLLDPVQHRLLRAIVDNLADAGRLRHFAPLRDKAGFIRALRVLIQELKQTRIEPPDLIAAAKALGQDAPHLHDLAAIYDAYQNWLIGTDWVDAEGQGWLAAIALEENPHLAGDLRLLVVDGFDEFNPTQLAVLKLLADRAAETLILLTGDPKRARLAHRRFNRAIQAVTEALNVVPQPLPNLQPATCNLQSAQSAIWKLEASLFEPDSTRQPADGAVTFIEAQNRVQEARAALRWVKARLVRDAIPADQIAILARDLAPYHPFLLEIAAEFGLPLRTDTGAELSTNPAVAALMVLLALPVQDWPQRAVLDAWRSPYLDWTGQNITAYDAARLDAAARAGQVIGGLAQWREALARLKDASPAQDEAVADEDLPPSDVPLAAKAADLQAQFDAFVARVMPPPSATLRDYVAFIEDLIGDDPTLPRRYPSAEKSDGSLRVVARALQAPATADRDRAALRAFKDILRGLALAEATLTENETPSPLPYERLYRELWGAVEAATYPLPAPEATAAVLAAPILRARGLSFRAVALLGLAEGEFPQAEREDLLLHDADRTALQQLGLRLETRLQGDEATFFYQAITLAREKLLLTRPYLAEDGRQWEASPYWAEAHRLIDAPLHTVRPQDSIAPQDAASLPELVAAAASQPAFAAILANADDDDCRRAWQRANNGAATLHARQADAPSGLHEGDLAKLAARLARCYGSIHIWSASRLEAYATCPLHFLMLHDLALKPRTPPQEGFDVLTLGSMYHQVLENVYRRSPDDPLAALEATAQEVFGVAPQRYGFRPTALWERQKIELTQVLAKTIVALLKASQDCQPLAQEQPFGMRGRPPLIIPVGEGDELRLRGFIDRLDQEANGGVRVVDYKAGSTLISAAEIADGQRVQLPLYALAVHQALGLGEVSGGFYWHVGSARASSFRLEKFEGGVQGAIQTALTYTHAYVSAIRQGKFPPRPPTKGCPRHCPATAFCWRYTPQWGAN